MKTRLLVSLVISFVLSLCGLVADHPEPAPAFVMPVGTNTYADLRIHQGGAQELVVRWESPTNSQSLTATFAGTACTSVWFVSNDRAYSRQDPGESVTMITEAEEEALFDLALDLRKKWRIVGGVAFETTPYTVIAKADSNSGAVIFVLTSEGRYIAFDQFHFKGSWPLVGDKVLIGRVGDTFCPVTFQFGDPVLGSEMLRFLAERDVAKK